RRRHDGVRGQCGATAGRRHRADPARRHAAAEPGARQGLHGAAGRPVLHRDRAGLRHGGLHLPAAAQRAPERLSMSPLPHRKPGTTSAGGALIAEVRRRLQEKFGDIGSASGQATSPSLELLDTHRIGRIVSIEGTKLVVMIEIEDAKAQVDLSHSLQVGCVVKVPTKNSVAFGMVNALSIAKPAKNGEQTESRFLELELVGESVAVGTGKGANMRRGVSTYPILGSPVYAATQADLRFVFVRDGPQSARIGSIQQDPNLPAQVNVDDLLGKHFAVLGATGTGKSCAVTLILKAILKHNPNGHV